MNRPLQSVELPSRAARSSAGLIRAAASLLIAEIQNGEVEQVAKSRWPNDPAPAVLLRAATTPATTTSSSWAGSLASTAVAEFIGSLGPVSAGATLLAKGIQLAFEQNSAILVPTLIADKANATFVGEAAPIPMRGLSLTGPMLTPHKFATIAPFTRELFEHSTPNIEVLVRAVLTESVGLSLDAALLDDTAASSTRPAGLLNGIAPLTASNLSTAADRMIADVSAIIGAVAGVSANGPVMLIVASGSAAALRLSMRNAFGDQMQVLASSALAAGTLIAVAPNAVASAVDPVPRFEIARDATVQMEDDPTVLSAIGTPNVIAAPIRSFYQSDTLGLRLILQVAWGLRSAAGIAWISGANW